MRGIFQLAVIFCLASSVSCKRNDIPALDDGKKLQADCVRLMLQYPQGPISSTLWPNSIKELKPMSVIREENNIRILLKHEDGKFSVGYHVYSDPQLAPSTQGVWIQKTKTRGVYIYKTAY